MTEDDAGLASMTGFGRHSTYHGGRELCVECRSVNHKRLSTRVDTPDELGWLQPKISSRLNDVLNRGRVDVRVQVRPADADHSPQFDVIDEERFAAVAQTLTELAGDCGLCTPVGAEAIFEYTEFFERSTSEVLDEQGAEVLLEVFDEALGKLIGSRRREGQGIARQMAQYLEQLDGLLDEVVEFKERADDDKWSAVETRLREAVEQFGVDEIDENRLAQEVAYYVEKGDIAEELQRARAHVDNVGELITGEREAVGKKLDFYLQELVRETNTMASKSRHPRLTECIIDMKSIVEKMREQAANIE